MCGQSVCARFGVFIIIWVVVDCGWCWVSHHVVSSSFVVVVVWSLLSSIVVVPSHGLLVGQALIAHQLTMMNDEFGSVVRHLAATSLTATWHLGCLSVKGGQVDDLLCMVTMLGVITIKWRRVVSVVG